MTGTLAPPPPPERHRAFADEPIPKAARDALNWYALVLGMPNVLMQLSNLKVGYGVAESKVESGRIDKHPLKRGRTTLTFLAVASNGTGAEREYLRQEVNRAHRLVRSDANSPVKYNAFDRDLQLWVAACLYRGAEDLAKALDFRLTPQDWAAFYRHSARFATTLQVPEDMWPPDRAAFEEYWNASVKSLEVDDRTRALLHDLATLAFLPTPFHQLFGPLTLFLCTGFLPQEFRTLLNLKWTPRSQQTFDHFVRLSASLNRLLPPFARQFPFNLYLWDFRRRMHRDLPII